MPGIDIGINATHDPRLRSWIKSANSPGCDFPIQNLPFGVFEADHGAGRGGVAIGDQILDLAALADSGLLEGEALSTARAASGDDLTPLFRLGSGPASVLRSALSSLLREQVPAPAREALSRLLVPMDSVEMRLPAQVRQFSDMCVSTFHIGRRRGTDERGEPICPPMFRTIPVGYDGRASSVVVSGTPVRRPNGTWETIAGSGTWAFGAEPRQDYELELGIWLGGEGNVLGEPILIGAAAGSIFGYSLLNDWSARGIQMWETMLGPFLGKSLATTVSPWIVTAEALAPFRIPAFARPVGDPTVPPHLCDAADQTRGGLDLVLSASLLTAKMQQCGAAPATLCETNSRYMYWTPAQMIAHHSSNGCSLAAGDLLGTGTVSGPLIEEAACLMERTMHEALMLADGDQRRWLEDGDTVVLRGKASRRGYVSIGFGEARGMLIPALQYP